MKTTKTQKVIFKNKGCSIEISLGRGSEPVAFIEMFLHLINDHETLMQVQLDVDRRFESISEDKKV